MQKIMFNDHYGLTNAVLEGKKTQTRRLALNVEDTQVFNLYPEDESIRKYVKGRYSRYSIGETLAIALPYKQLKFYGVSLSEKTLLWTRHEIEPDESIRNSPGWNNKMFVKAEFMPHQIRITNIRLEHLQDISDEDCIKEGIIEDCPGVQYSFPTEIGYCDQYPFATPKAAYAALIDKISGKGTWEKNPWVFVYDFELVNNKNVMETNKTFELYKYIIEEETKNNREFNLPIHNSTFVFKPIKKNIRLNDAKDEIIMTACDIPDFITKEEKSTFPFTVVLKKEGNDGPSPRYVLEGTLFESLDAEGYLLKYKDELEQRHLI